MSRLRLFVALVVFGLEPGSAVAQAVDLYGDPLPPGAVARLGTVRWRHGMHCYAACFSPDGQRIRSCGAAGTAQSSLMEWDPSSGAGKVIGQFEHARNTFPAIAAFGGNGKVLGAVAAGPKSNMTILLIDAGSCKELQRITSDEGSLFSLAIAPDGKTVATGSTNPGVRLWDIATGNELRKLGEDNMLSYSLTFSLDGKYVAAGDPEKTLRIWEVATGRELAKLTGQPGYLRSAFSPDGKTLAWQGGETIRVWDFVTRKEDRTLTGKPINLSCLVYTPDGKFILAGDAHGSISIWDVAAGQEIRRWPGHGNPVMSLGLAPDGKSFVSCSGYEGGIRVWRLPDGAEVNSFPGHQGSVGAIRSFDGQSLLSWSLDNTLREWEVRSGRSRQVFGRPRVGMDYWAICPSLRTLITYDYRDETLHQWDAASGKELRVLGNFSRPRGSSHSPNAFTADGKLLAYRAEGGMIRICELEQGLELHRLLAHKDELVALCFSPDGKILASAANNQGLPLSDHALRLWDVSTGRELWYLDQPLGAMHLVFSHDGRVLAASGYWGQEQVAQGVLLWEVASGRRLGRVPNTGSVHSFSTDARRLAVQDAFPGTSGVVRVIETATCQEALILQTHQTELLCSAISTDGRLLATGCMDSTILLWDLTFGISTGPKTPPRPEELKTRWSTLASADAAAAYKAIWSLVATPKESVPFLAEKLKPAVAVDEKRIADLIAALDSDKFAEREKAGAELEELGEIAGPALEKLLKGKPSQEAKRRAEAIVAKLGGPVTSPETLRTLRAIEALEHIGTPEAMAVIEKLAKGAAGARETEDARRTLERLKKRQK